MSPSATLDELVDFLGPEAVRHFVPGRGKNHLISMAIIYDQEDPIVATPGGLLLFTARAASAFSRDFLQELAAAGFSGIVVKDRDGALAAIPEDPPIGVLVIVEEISWRQLFALVSAASHRRAAEHNSEHNTQSLFSIANSIAAALGGAAAIEDRERNVLAYSTVIGHTVDHLRRDGILARQVPDLPKHNNQYRELYGAQRPVAFPLDPEDGELPRIAIAIRAGQEILGSIWVILENDLSTERNEAVLVDAAALAAIQLLRHRSWQDIEAHLREEWLRAALSGEPAENWNDSRFRIKSRTPVVLFAIRPEEAKSASSPYLSELKLAAVSTARLHGLEASAAVVNNRCYMLVGNLHGKAAAQRVAENVGNTLSKRFSCRLSIAVGPFEWQDAVLGRVRVELDDVLTALDYHDETCQVLFIDDIRPGLLLRALSRHLPSYQRLTSPELATLRVADASTGNEYERTLLEFLSSLGDIPVAAQRLQVHPNTLRYRMKRIAELSGIELSDSDTVLALWVELWAHQRATRSVTAQTTPR